MTPRVRIGLIVGTVGLAVTACVSAALGLCGPLTALLAGGIAGFLAAGQEKQNAPADGARRGAVAGLIVGALTLVGQAVGGVLTLVFVQSFQLPTFFGSPPPVSDTAGTLGYWLGGVATGLCFGLLGLIAAALAGAFGGYFGTPSQPKAGGIT